MDQKDKPKQETTKTKSSINQKANHAVWDCGSTLYDSFELNSFKRQLDSAIANSFRTFSMSRLPDRKAPLLISSSQKQQQQQQQEQEKPAERPPTMSKKPFKISRSLQRLLRSVFKPNKPKIINSTFGSVQEQSKDHGLYLVCDMYGYVLSTIPEVPEIDIGGLSPEVSSLVKRSASDRFVANSIGISCA